MSKLPKHIAIVMDGNGRWAKQRKLPRIAGHREGAKAVRRAIEFCVKNKIKALTLFALSIENCRLRPPNEVKFLLSLFLDSLIKNTEELHSNNVKIRVIGDKHPLEKKLLHQIDQSEKQTQHNSGLELVIAINYSGRWDIVQASRKITEAVQNQQLSIEDIDEKHFQRFLCLSDLPEPDLLIRTSGELRMSNFMLWQLAYTELFFSPIYWPDFDENIFSEAIATFQSRERRFGQVGEYIELQDA